MTRIRPLFGRTAVIVVLACAATWAGACPPVSFDAAREGSLIAELQDAPDERAARRLNAELWDLWTKAPDAYAQDLLDSGVARLRLGDTGNAIKAFDALVAYCPHFAEGYNQRAFARYLRREYEPALVDLEHVLELSPRHIGALSGKALTLMGLDRDREALVALEKALGLNPWLSERSLLPLLEDRLGAEKL